MRRRLWVLATMAIVAAGLLVWTSLAGDGTDGGSREFIHFQLPLPPGGVEEAGQRVADAIAAELFGSVSPQAGYPRTGRLVLVDVPDKPGWKRTTCDEGEAPLSAGRCIALDDRGDLIEMRLIGVPIAAFYPFLVYLAPPGARPDLDMTPRIAMRVHASGDPAQQWAVYESVRSALRIIGAKGFSPKSGSP